MLILGTQAPFMTPTIMIFGFLVLIFVFLVLPHTGMLLAQSLSRIMITKPYVGCSTTDEDTDDGSSDFIAIVMNVIMTRPVMFAAEQ